MKVRLAWLSSCILVAACGSGDKNKVLSRLEAAGDRCPTGGVVVISGVDDDGDGSLDTDEVDTTDLLCSNNTLTRVDAIPPGDICPAGGTAVNAGVDDNDDGVLADAEIDTTQRLCKGTLVRSTALGPSDAACFGRGGVRLEIGVDDDGDDVLDVEEVDATTYTCNVPGTTTPPAGPAGTGTIVLDGGKADEFPGGTGGQLLAFHGASGGGSLAIFRTGTVDASFTMPTRTPVPGANPLVLAASTSVPEVVAGVAGGPAAGVLYASNPTGNYQLMLSDGDAAAGDETPFTSLTVPAGMTLTLQGGATLITLAFTDDVVNNGTITRTGANRGLALVGRAYVGGPGSTINLVGAASGTGPILSVVATEIFLNEGILDTSGGAGTTSGGAAGDLTVTVQRGSLFNRGELRAIGGAASSAASVGGFGGAISLRAFGGKVANSGNLTSAGGVGLGTGASGRAITLFGQPGNVINSGTLDSHGASPMGCTTTCAGGTGFPIQLESQGGGVFSSGALISRGGSVLGTAGTSCGGGGGVISVNAAIDDDQVATLDQGSVRLSGNIDTSAGASADCAGLSGGALIFFVRPRYPQGQEVLLLGYASVSTQGGASRTSSGGAAGAFTLARGSSFSTPTAAGPVINYADVNAVGGATEGSFVTGGRGGQIRMGFGSADFLLGQGTNRVISNGKITADGAQGGYGGSANNSGYAAAVLYGPEGVASGGDISVKGGAGSIGGSGIGGSGGRVVISSDFGQVTNTAKVTASGGTANSGGYAGPICLEGNYVNNSGALTANGGDGGANGPGSGNEIRLMSFGQPTTNTGALSTATGAGAPPSTSGAILIDTSTDRCFSNL